MIDISNSLTSPRFTTKVYNVSTTCGGNRSSSKTILVSFFFFFCVFASECLLTSVLMPPSKTGLLTSNNKTQYLDPRHETTNNSRHAGLIGSKPRKGLLMTQVETFPLYASRSAQGWTRWTGLTADSSN